MFPLETGIWSCTVPSWIMPSLEGSKLGTSAGRGPLYVSPDLTSLLNNPLIIPLSITSVGKRRKKKEISYKREICIKISDPERRVLRVWTVTSSVCDLLQHPRTKTALLRRTLTVSRSSLVVKKIRGSRSSAIRNFLWEDGQWHRVSLSSMCPVC